MPGGKQLGYVVGIVLAGSTPASPLFPLLPSLLPLCSPSASSLLPLLPLLRPLSVLDLFRLCAMAGTLNQTSWLSKHARLKLVALRDLSSKQTGFNLLVLLNKRAAVAPVRRATITKSAAFDTKLVTNFGSLHHGIAIASITLILVGSLERRVDLHPAAAKGLDTAHNHAVSVKFLGRLQRTAAEALRRSTQDCLSRVSLSIHRTSAVPVRELTGAWHAGA